MEYRILLVEDEKPLADMIKLNLEMEGYVVVHAADGLSAIDRFRNQKFDLGILDIMIPEVNGLDVCQTIRLDGNMTPVLFLSAKGTGVDRVEGLKIGGDDYLTKPFHLEELLLRVQKLINRHSDGKRSLADVEEYSFGPNKLNFTTYVIHDKNGKSITITKREIMLLRLLVQKQGEVVSREEILEKVWGYSVFPSTRTIDNYILAFRRYFEPDSRQPRYFHSVRGVGYKFTP